MYKICIRYGRRLWWPYQKLSPESGGTNSQFQQTG